jgi:signal transduction histidine kinase
MLVLTQVAASLLLGSRIALVAYTNIVYLLLILLATSLVARNVVRNVPSRGFWALLTAGYCLWALSSLIWGYDVVWLHENIPNLGLTDPTIFLHTVLFTAALALGPYVRVSGQKDVWTRLDFILLLLCWTSLYLFVELPTQGTPRALDTFTVLYTTENLLLVAVLGLLMFRIQSPAWKVIYRHMFAASSLYLCGSVAANLSLSIMGSESSLADGVLIAAACWFVYIPVLGWKTSSQLAEVEQRSSGQSRLISLSAVLAMIGISLLAIWATRTQWAPESGGFRLTIILVSTLLITFFVVTKDFFEQDKLANDLSSALLKQSQLKTERLELSGRLILAQEAERSRIARDLHDDVNQRIARLGDSLSEIADELRDSDIRHKLERSIEQVHLISLDIQHLSHQLHSSTLQYLGLGAAVNSLCEEFARENRIRVERQVQDSVADLDHEASLALFRILQEGLHNVAKHSRATQVSVELLKDSSGIHLSLTDNGVGFDFNKDHEGLGMTSMRERARLVGGELEIWSQASRGTRVQAILPVSRLGIGSA